MKDQGTTTTTSTTKTPETTTNDGAKTETTGKETTPDVNDVLDTPEFETGDPVVDRQNLLNALGGDNALLTTLLSAATLPSGAGTPIQRLERVLAANPATPKTEADLLPLIEAQKKIDEKILLGRFDGRDMKGGHSPDVLTDKSFVYENAVANPNGTVVTQGIRKLLQVDTGNHAGMVESGDPNSAVAQVGQVSAIGDAVAAQPNPVWPAKMPQAIKDRNQAAFDAAKADLAAALANLGPLITEVTNAAPDAKADPTNASKVAPFSDALRDALAGADSIVSALKVMDSLSSPKTTNAANAKAILDALKLQLATDGPMMSAKKPLNTIAPPGWTNSDVLKAGDDTAAVPAELIRHPGTPNAPANGATVQSMHMKVVNGVVWVVIKENATYNAGPPPSTTGGVITSSYPTADAVIPANPAMGAINQDGFGLLM